MVGLETTVAEPHECTMMTPKWDNKLALPRPVTEEQSQNQCSKSLDSLKLTNGKLFCGLRLLVSALTALVDNKGDGFVPQTVGVVASHRRGGMMGRDWIRLLISQSQNNNKTRVPT